MRGGLDDALDKLARRDELRRRTAGEAAGTPPAVQELVEAIVGVVARNPKLEVTVGVEGAGDPTLLHFSVEDGLVQVNADSTVASRVQDAAPTSPRHADFDIDLDDPIEAVRSSAQPQHADSASGHMPPSDSGGETHRISYDDRDRYDPGTGYGTTAYGEPDPYSPAEPGHDPIGYRPTGYETYDSHRHAVRDSAFPPDDTVPEQNPYRLPLAATPPPPVPPQAHRRIRPEHYRAPEEPSAAERRRVAQQRPARAEHRGMPNPLPEPVPLHVDSAETEQAAKRLAALVRDNPTLLRQAPPE